MEVTIFDDLFNPKGMNEDAMHAWLGSYLTYEAHTQHINLGKLRQHALMDVLMKYSPTFRSELNDYRTYKLRSAIKLDCTLNEINKIFDEIIGDTK